MKDEENTSIVQQKIVADTYKIPCLSIGARLWKDIVIENGGAEPAQDSAIWGKYMMDTVHPLDAGYAKYASYVTKYLQRIFERKTSVPSACVNAYKPKSNLMSLPVSPYATNFKGQDDNLLNLFKLDSNGFLTADKTGASFSFTFKGTELKLWAFARPRGGVLSISIDGGSAKQITVRSSVEAQKLFKLASGMENKEHTVRVSLSTSTYGTYVQIKYFLISGDDQKSGVRLKQTN